MSEPVVAWQKQIRDKLATEDKGDGLLGKWWEGRDLTLNKAVVREIDFVTARQFIEKYEWLGTIGSMLLHAYGIFFQGALGGVVVYRVEYINHLGKWDGYGFTDKIICLSRGACAHWSPKGTASRLIRRSMDLLPPKYEIITAPIDREAGEVGTIYQACGFHYVGQLSPGMVASVTRPDGRKIHGHQLMKLYGTRSAKKLIALGVDGVTEHQVKERYFGFRGNLGAKRRHLAAMAHIIKPYPKRATRPLDEPAPRRSEPRATRGGRSNSRRAK